MLGKEIAVPADVDSRAAFEVLRLLLNMRSDDGFGKDVLEGRVNQENLGD